VTDVAAPRAPAPAVAAIPNRWLPALVFFATLVIASVLLFVRVSSTPIELTGTFSGVGFVSGREQPLGHPMRLSALGASGVKGVELPEEVPAAGSTTALRVGVEETPDGRQVGSIVMDRIMVPEGTQVWLTATDVRRQYRLSLRAPTASAIEVHADVMGGLAFAPSSATRTTTVLRAPRGVDFQSSTAALDLDLTLPQDLEAPPPRWEQVVVRDLRVYRVEDVQDVARPLVRPVSTIQSGSLYFEALGSTERKLRPGELLRFGAASGTFLTLDLRSDGIAATFQGDVRGMRTGSGDDTTPLMPTLLEWLRKRQALSLLWGTALYLSGIGLTLRRWWRKPE
jgi:hypothetical protein